MQDPVKSDISSTEKSKQKLPIPLQDIYRAHVLNSAGHLETIYIFCAGTLNRGDLNELFSESEIAYYEANKVKILFSGALLCKEDSIHTIKRKIVQELSDKTVSLDELYLFASNTCEIDMDQVYQEATKNETEPFTKERFFQYALNLGADPFVLEQSVDAKSDVLEKDVFSYKDWSALMSSGSHEIFMPLGLKFQDKYDFLFASNPYQLQLWTEPIRFEISPKNPRFSFENTLLLNYGKSNDIMVCLAKNVLEFATERGIDQEYMIGLYFPFLQKRGILGLDKLSEMSHELAEENAKQMTSGLRRHYETIDIFHEIYWARKNELAYSKRGIQAYSIRLSPSDFKHTIPLDALFRTMKVTKDMPFIKYNPGSRRENMYRLFSDRISANGKKIPVLAESLIMKLMRETGKGHQISIYLKAAAKQDGDLQDVYINLDATSHIQIYGELTELMDMITLEDFLIKTVGPVINRLNGLIQSSGYILRNFKSLTSNDIETSRYTYRIELPIQKTVKIAEQMSYLSSAFDVISSDVSKDGAVMRFKRVENFREMDAQSSLITEIYQRTGYYKNAAQALIDNYGMTDEEALLRLAAYSSEHEQLKGKILDNPGFPTIFKMQPAESKIIVEISEIISAEYLDILPIYIDTILRMTQDPNSTNVSPAKLKQFRTKNKITDLANIAQNKEAELVDNIVAPVGLTITSELNKIQPLRFIEEEPEQGEDEEEGGLTFDEDYDYDYEEEGEAEEEGIGKSEEEQFGGEGTPSPEEYKANIDGLSLKHPTPFFRKMEQRDPVLFLTEKQKGFDLYSRACPSDVKRQPVILTDEEKAHIDKTNPGSYDHAINYGSDPKKKFWYICPRFWCLKTNSSITEADVKAGKCGSIIPPNSPVVPPGAYVYEFSHPKEHVGNDGKYIKHIPGFLDKSKHPNGLCIPCCFKKEWNSEQHIKRRAQCGQDQGMEGEGKEDEAGKVQGKKMGKAKAVDAELMQSKAPIQKMINYIIGSVSYPIPSQRWGFLPMAVQLFLGTDNSAAATKQNAALIRPNTPCLLRYGVEQTSTQSFLGCIAHFYAYKHNLVRSPSIEEMRDILAKSISLDLFVRYHNGNLAAIFRPKTVNQGSLDIDQYSNTAFYKLIDLNNETQVDYLEDTIASYEHLLEFLQDETSIIDHTYLWDIICDRNPLLMRDGVNLVILKMADNDITEKVQMICPSNAYSTVSHDPSKETIILVKQEDFYEPIHLYEQMENGEIVMKKAFLEGAAIKNIQDMLALIKQASKEYCTPQPSMPKKYTFKQNMPIQEIMRILKIHHYRIESQVMNYRNKAIGLRVNREEGQDWLFVPCYPSGLVNDLKTRHMDENGLWIDYKMTRDRLLGISTETGGKILCKPTVKIVEDNLVVGFLTETNQFVQIDPPQQNIVEDDIKSVVYHSSYATSDGNESADKVLTMTKTEDASRIETIRKISLETQFYNVFRSTIRLLLNEYENRQVRQSIKDCVDDVAITYHNKLADIERYLKTLTKDAVSFQEFDPAVLASLDDIMACQVDEAGQCSTTTGPETKYCLTLESGGCQTVFPKRHLLSGFDNERIYFGRLADELLRYRRIQLFMFQSKTYLNIANPEYRVGDDELFLLESLLNHEYFRDLVPYNVNRHIQNIEYDTANPAISQTYSNEISLAEQVALVQSSVEKTAMSEYILDCIRETKPRVVGNEKAGSWNPVFPVRTKEMVFGNNVICSYIPMIYILQEIHKKMGISVQNVKIALWNGYKQLMELFGNKIVGILRKQGKRGLMENVKGNNEQIAAALERVIFSEEYYISDLDWWVLARAAKLPVVLFSTTTLKHLLNNVNWLRLGGSDRSNEPYFFVRSPVDLRTNPIPSYHVLTPAYTFEELRDDMFVKAIRGNPAYVENMQSLDEYLAKSHIIMRK